MTPEQAIRGAMERTRNTITLDPSAVQGPGPAELDHLADLADAVLDQLEAIEGVDAARARKLAHHLCRKARVESKTTVAGVRAGLMRLGADHLVVLIEWCELLGPKGLRHRLVVEYRQWVEAKKALYGAVSGVLAAESVGEREAVGAVVEALKARWGVESLHEMRPARLEEAAGQVAADGWALVGELYGSGADEA